MDKQAKKDAHEFARAKMFYGEGAGNRRKLINAKVKERSKDPAYRESFEKYMSQQNMSKHADAAKSERHRKDVTKTTAKTARGVYHSYMGNAAKISAGAAATFAVLHYTGLDKQLLSKAKGIRNNSRSFKGYDENGWPIYG